MTFKRATKPAQPLPQREAIYINSAKVYSSESVGKKRSRLCRLPLRKASGFPEAPFLNYSRLCLAAIRRQSLRSKPSHSESRRLSARGGGRAARTYFRQTLKGSHSCRCLTLSGLQRFSCRMASQTATAFSSCSKSKIERGKLPAVNLYLNCCPICSVPNVPIPFKRKLNTTRFSFRRPTLKV